MTDGSASIEKPFWVKVGLWGIPTRASALHFIWFSTASAAASGAYGFRDSRFFLGTGLLLASLWYWLSMRWVDRHGGWPATK